MLRRQLRDLAYVQREASIQATSAIGTAQHRLKGKQRLKMQVAITAPISDVAMVTCSGGKLCLDKKTANNCLGDFWQAVRVRYVESCT